ncbi:MAG: hypothetical protein JW856_01850 [Dehalococcoidales bacterium]|nr:hypothetical protein [Dehalococcoidales bacterium]
MNLSEMRTTVRRDLHDEDANNYRWTNDELDRHIVHAVRDYSEAVPYEQKAIKATGSGSREIDISSLNDRIMVEAVEYPLGNFPQKYQRFALWSDVITLLGDEIPNGSDACIYYGKIHTLNVESSSIPVCHENLIVAGACGYAALEWAVYAINRVNVGGTPTPGEFNAWGREKMDFFRGGLKRLSRKNRVRVRSLYRPYIQSASKSTDFGP